MKELRTRSAIVVAVVALAVCSGCGSTNTEPTGSTTSSTTTGATASSTSATSSADCVIKAPGPSSIDDVFADIPAFTVKQVCPADVDPAFAGPKFEAEFHAVAAADVAQNGSPVLKAFAGQLKSGTGDDFVRGFLSDLSTTAAPNRTVASEPKEVGGPGDLFQHPLRLRDLW
ncbi:MAG: hypothetical protein QOI28_265 [Mycobacterium sp.]|nr:hypothetical protein [Mycobacterium sp.]